MNKKFSKFFGRKQFGSVVSFLLVASFVAPVFAGCKNNGGSTNSGSKSFDNEKDALVFSSGEFDGVFSPFFATSAYDTGVVGQTQISMLSSDDTGNVVVYGKDEPVVTLDYSEIMYDSNGNQTTTGDEDGTTVYQMVLKKDILFSDGQPLTAHDVLFNMYVYLDPAYTGSSTMYSTDIVGLRNYQMQQEGDISEGAVAAQEETFANLARQRMTAIIAYVKKASNASTLMSGYTDLCAGQQINRTYNTDAVQKDIETIKSYWVEEITTDWNAASSDLASMQTEYPFTQPWQLYFYREGLISRKSVTTAGVTTYPKDDNGKYIIEWQQYGYDPNATYTKEQAIEEVKNAYLTNDEFVATILGGWATSGTIATLFAAEDKELYYEARKQNGQLTVKNIEGIKIKSAKDFSGTKKYPEENYNDYEMLEITINGVDPKAKWNFAFSVSPMHYYSTSELTAAALSDTDYDSDFGVKYSSVEFMNSLKRRNKVPMGAGIYKASTMNDYVYDWNNDADSFNKLADGFLSNNVCYFIRNDNFVTTGGNKDAVYNAKIKHVQYKVVNSANTMTALQSGAIHYADPSATTDNITIIDDHSDLNRIMSKTAGYGYIGINAKFVPNIYVRRAIMSAMDISLVQNYYPGTLSEPIYRAFSKVSWVYNEFEDDGIEAWDPVSLDGNTDEQYYPYYNDEAKVKQTIKDYLEDGDCVYKGGKWYDKDGKTLLKYTFTVAGDTTDHPAYKTFLKARDILNEMGMEIEVIPDSRALFKLASGNLAIWAAAWSASLDPDMYQVYHKDSKATSILNWGYDHIKTEGTSEEKSLVESISELIDKGRETIIASERATYYRQASDLVMDLAVELPVYQRSDMNVYNNKVLDATTFKKNPTPFAGPLSEMWKVSFVKNN